MRNTRSGGDIHHLQTNSAETHAPNFRMLYALHTVTLIKFLFTSFAFTDVIAIRVDEIKSVTTFV